MPRASTAAALWLGALALPLALGPAPARAQAGGVQWIWFHEGDPANDAPTGARYFRRAFGVGRAADEATLDVTADNAFTVCQGRLRRQLVGEREREKGHSSLVTNAPSQGRAGGI
jgi:hypothetical protein